MKHNRFTAPLNRVFFILLFMAAIITSNHQAAQAQNGPVIIRDTEIETTLKRWSEPVIRAAGLDPEAINLILIQDPNINAFVAGGQNIFLYTGLLTRSENAAEIIGVIAHELGHIRGGHLVRTRGALENASYESLLGTILGIGAAVITGEGGLGAAIAAGASSTATNRFLAFSRVQESSADQAALDYLEKAGINPSGLVSFMQKLENEELLPSSQQSEYIRTHPLTRNRVDALTAGKKRSEHKGKAFPATWEEEHARMIAKLVSFITPEQVAWQYDSRDNSVTAQYARTIAAYRKNDIDRSLQGIDRLLLAEPENPYFWELKGQMLVDYGRINQAIAPYSKALEIKPDASLIRVAYAHALIESAQNDHTTLTEAIEHLERALYDERRSPRIHRLLATAYGRQRNESMAKLHLAEEALLQNRRDQAGALAKLAASGLEEKSRAWIRAQDILNYIEQSNESN